ncbi:MAG: ABC transporter permease [Planctomycetota bacterium]
MEPAPRIISVQEARRRQTLGHFLAYLLWLWRHLRLVETLARTELKRTVSRSKLYYLWWMFDPLLDTACYAFLFLMFRPRTGTGEIDAPILIFLLAGIIPFRWTSSCCAAAANTWKRYANLIQQVRFPYLVLPGATFRTEGWLYLCALGVLLAATLAYGLWPTAAWFALPLWLVLHALVTLALMLPVAVLAAFSSDFTRIVPYGLRLLFFATPILYTPDQLPELAQPVANLNPLAHIVSGYRAILLDGAWPNPVAAGALAAVALVGLALGAFWFVRSEPFIARSISRTTY